jgi:hypothetical protein
MAWRRDLGTALAWALTACLTPPAWGQTAVYDPQDFMRQVFKTRFERELQFRAAAIEVAWRAERLCDATTEIEPFVLWSLGTLGKPLAARELKLYGEVTGMDQAWRVAWLGEGAPGDLHLGDAVIAINGRPLPTGGTRLDLGAVWRGASPVSNDDQPFWDLMHQAREEARRGQTMRITLHGGRELSVPTRTGCAGVVTATGFDHEPDRLGRQGSERVKIPANAMLEARSRDEFRWLAAFGTFFQANQQAIAQGRESDQLVGAFEVGKILALAVPGAGLLLSVLEPQAERMMAVDSVAGQADLFANEVVAAMGGDPSAGWRFNERLASLGLAVDVLGMTPFRRANAQAHAQRLSDLQAARGKSPAEAESAEPRAQEATPPTPLALPSLVQERAQPTQAPAR